jgi:hypothetical protein
VKRYATKPVNQGAVIEAAQQKTRYIFLPVLPIFLVKSSAREEGEAWHAGTATLLPWPENVPAPNAKGKKNNGDASGKPYRRSDGHVKRPVRPKKMHDSDI